MMSRRDPEHVGTLGFTLIETLVALALMGLILSGLATITSQWMPNWNRGFDRIQRSESVSIALERISSDIAAAEYVRPDRQSKNILFNGSELSVTFARAAFGPNAKPGLDIVRIAETADSQGIVMTRSLASFVPGAGEGSNFVDPVVLLRAPYRVSFSYAGRDRIWKNAWRETDTLPVAVMLTVRDAATERTLPISRIAVIHVDASAESVCAQSEGGCGGKPSGSPDAPPPNAAAGANANKQ
jgi:general secretion pathway protein J